MIPSFEVDTVPVEYDLEIYNQLGYCNGQKLIFVYPTQFAVLPLILIGFLLFIPTPLIVLYAIMYSDSAIRFCDSVFNAQYFLIIMQELKTSKHSNFKSS